MTTKLTIGLVLFLCFLGSDIVQASSICNYDCVATDVYIPYCGGAVCVYGEVAPSQHAQLCSEECANAILGRPLRDCVLSQDPNIRNLVSETQNMVRSIRAFCDNAEPSMTAPGSAPASEPLTPSSETPGSTEAPASSIPIDPPESAPPSAETEPSTAIEPSVAAVSSISAEPSIAAVSSISAEPSIAAVSSISEEPSIAVESFMAAEPSVEAFYFEPVESPEALDSAIAYISGVSPEAEIAEDDDVEVLEALDML